MYFLKFKLPLLSSVSNLKEINKIYFLWSVEYVRGHTYEEPITGLRTEGRRVIAYIIITVLNSHASCMGDTTSCDFFEDKISN